MKVKTLNQNFVFLIIGQASSMFGTALLKFIVLRLFPKTGQLGLV